MEREKKIRKWRGEKRLESGEGKKVRKWRGEKVKKWRGKKG